MDPMHLYELQTARGISQLKLTKGSRLTEDAGSIQGTSLSRPIARQSCKGNAAALFEVQRKLFMTVSAKKVSLRACREGNTNEFGYG